MSSYLIGVDAGGSKTEAIAYDLSGEEVASGTSGYGNPLIHPQRAKDHIVEAIRLCMQSHHAEHCVAIVAGVAGIDSGRYRDELSIAIKQIVDVDCLLLSDVQLAHAGALQGEDGIVTIAGTGSISWGVRDGNSHRTGGWGHLLGDEGSGYWLVMELLKKIIREEESDERLSPLSRRFLLQLQVGEVSALKTFVYASTKQEIAAWVPFLVNEAQQGDSFARMLLTRAGEELGKITVRLWRKLQYQRPVPIAMKGSIFVHIPMVRDAFMAYLREMIPNATITLDTTSATKGAYYLYVNELKSKDK